ncbi:hypothetical protein [Streptomyces cadmiisoli]|uniref:hypothetical protein n=1 Tax=Streptomyces cadmiisoli TaxID=2184053 RepID=UPI00364E77CA
MTRATENRIDVAATVVSLAAEATELESRVARLRAALVDLDERMTAVHEALRRISSA